MKGGDSGASVKKDEKADSIEEEIDDKSEYYDEEDQDENDNAQPLQGFADIGSFV